MVNGPRRLRAGHFKKFSTGHLAIWFLGFPPGVKAGRFLKSKIMTEESYQQGRKFMRSVNHIRGLITKAEGEVAKWTKIEDSHRKELRPSQADGAKKCLDKAMRKLNELRLQFDAMKFPESNIIVARKRSVQCEGCGATIAEGNTYCGECLCEDDSE